MNQRTQQLTAVVEALRESEARTRLTIDTALDAVVAMDAHGLVREWNAQAETIFGWKRDEAIGKPLAGLVIPLQHREGHARGLERFLATNEGPILSQRLELTALHREGREFPVELSITPMLLQGEWTFSAFLRDITDRKQMEERTLNLNRELEQRVAQRTTELVAAREAADTANRAKSTFLATMSHEIRTPMNGMFGMLELLGLTELDTDQRATLAIVRESSQSLLCIIDDILDFSKIEAGKLTVRPEVASIKDVIEHVRNMYAGNASGRGLLLKHGTDPQISPALMFDPLRLGQILNNLVSNALKFTSRGSIEIKAELIARTNGEDQVRFVVTDTGMGVSAEDQQRLFQPFTQGGGDTARWAGGTGLGLTICRRLAGMMNGTVEMVSELGKGTTMILTLSLPIADPKELAKIRRAQMQDSARTTHTARRDAPTVAAPRRRERWYCWWMTIRSIECS
ncbi:PAS domain S-box protein [Polaromonas sp. P1(28)-8]|nr:PAS domain S-box protein [Polaromonas sp. P1(28)-8]